MKYNIWTNCPQVPMTSLLSFIVDNRGKTVPTTDSGHILIATNCVNNKTLYPIYDKVRYLSEETYQKWFRAHPISGDILFVNKGTPGRVCMVPDPVDFCIAQDMISLRADSEKIYNKYLFAILRSTRIQQQIYNTYVGDVIPHFKKQFLNQLLIPVPERKIQEAIGDFYFDLSYKIELNNKINANLEAQAQAIFKSWFVDFEPFQDGEFVDSELGPIPKGWKVGNVSDFVLEMKNGGTPNRKNMNYWDIKDYPWIKTGEILNQPLITCEEYISKSGLDNSSAKLLPIDSVLIALYGATAAKVALLKFEAATNQACCAMICRSPNSSIYLYLNLMERQEYIKSLAVGSAQQNLSKEIIARLPILLPDPEVIETLPFDVIYKAIEINIKQSHTIAALRDTLLPKLMSGEIEVLKEVSKP